MNNPPVSYDYIFTGMGCAGLSLAVQMAREGLLDGKRVLMLDRDAKTRNDRTWCFWEKDPGPFEAVVHRSWQQAWFHAGDYSRLLDLSPYTYKMIGGVDFYRYCLQELQAVPGLDFITETVEQLIPEGDGATVMAGGKAYRGGFVFNSILFEKPQPISGVHYLLQHFKGWIIDTAEPVFQTDQATLMDFRTPQDEGTTFVYVMPFSPTSALVEYTLFSHNTLPDEAYDEGLRNYITETMGVREYQVREVEFGIIPMTNHPFPRRHGHILHLGTAGGQTKASSGYTFRFIQKHAAQICQSIRHHGHPFHGQPGRFNRFNWYDSILLNILDRKKLPGWKIFQLLFRRNKVSTILQFLDNETRFSQEFLLLNTLPQWPFMKAGVQELV